MDNERKEQWLPKADCIITGEVSNEGGKCRNAVWQIYLGEILKDNPNITKLTKEGVNLSLFGWDWMCIIYTMDFLLLLLPSEIWQTFYFINFATTSDALEAILFYLLVINRNGSFAVILKYYILSACCDDWRTGDRGGENKKHLLCYHITEPEPACRHFPTTS